MNGCASAEWRIDAIHGLLRCSRRSLVLPAVMLAGIVTAQAQLPTVTTLTLSANTIGPLNSETLTATVTFGGGNPATSGLVSFCDAAATHCTDVHVAGTAQISDAAGEATLTLRTGSGVHRYQAVFHGTSTLAPSTSNVAGFTVTGAIATTNTMAATGNAGNYTLTSTVTEAGSPILPTGNVQFQDTSDQNFSLATAIFEDPVSAFGFTTSAQTTGGTGSYFVATGDFNRDGRPDIAISNNTSGNVSVLMQRADGTFAGATTIATLASPNRIVVADFNGDGIDDIAVVCLNGVSVLISQGDGLFTVHSGGYGLNGGYAIGVGDLNGDGIPDLIVTDTNALVLIGNGDGTFNTGNRYGAGTYPEGVAIGDFNGDGNLDVAISNFGDDPGTDSVNLLRGNGDGTFTASGTLQVNPSGVFTGGNFDAADVMAADFNNDGNMDLAIITPNRNRTTVFLGNGTGAFTNGGTAPYGGPFAAVADVNVDSIPDLLFPSYLLLGNGDGTFTAATALPTAGNYSTATADFNADGVADVVATNTTNNTVGIGFTNLSISRAAVAINISPAGTGIDQIQAAYSGDATFAASTSTTIGLQDELAATALVLGVEPTGTNYPQQAALTATLSPFAVQTYSTDGENITFYSGTTMLGTAPLNGGSAALNTTPGVGFNNYTAVYAGDAEFAANTSPLDTDRGFAGMPPVSAATTTTLNLSAATVTPGTVVILTAAVTSGPTLVYPGQVNFCDAAAATCTGIHLLGTAQLSTAGTASLSFIPGRGGHSYKAMFTGTASDTVSTSAAQPLTVTGTEPTQLALAASGIPGHYTLEATLAGTGDAVVPPNGMIEFLDESNAGAPLGYGPLVPGPALLNYLQSFNVTAGPFAQGVATGDFNGDGFADVVISNGNANTLTVLLGNGSGTFTAAPVVNTPANPTSIVVGDFNGDGRQDLAVTDVDDAEITVFLGAGNGTFTNAGSYETPGGPNHLAIGDFNNDGMQDLVATVDGDTNLAILIGNGDGTFQNAGNSPSVGANPASVTVADFNGDGNVDLAVVGDSTINALTILLGNGDGTFTAANANPATGAGPASVTAADLNGDGKPDLAVANSADSTITILLGNGDGTFTIAPGPATGLEPTSVLITDLNGDGVPDLLIAGYLNGFVQVRLGNGDGTFTDPGEDINVGSAPSFAAVADFNGDGVPDLVNVVEAPVNSTATMILTQRIQTATATLANVAPSGTPGMHMITSSYTSDLNFGGTTGGGIGLLVPPGSTVTLAITAAGNAVTTVASATAVTLTATVTANGTPVAPGTVTFCDATAPLCEDSAILGTAQLKAVGTAALTFVPGIGSHSYNAVFEGTSAGTSGISATQSLTVTGIYPTQTTITAAGTAGNYTLTGTVAGIGSAAGLAPTGNVSFMDATANNLSLGTAALGTSTAGLHFINPSNPATGNSAQSVSAGDFNGDGLADLVVANGNDNTLTVLLSNGDGTFTTVAATPATGLNPTLRAVGDLNGDGKADLAVADVYGDALTILLGNGDGTFTPVTAQPAVTEPISVAIGDFNDDGILDLAAVSYSTNTVTILLGNGDGTFVQAEASPATGASPYSIVTADFNRDGILDLAVANYVDQNVTILLGRGDGSFMPGITQPAGINAFFITSGDFNGDGNPDLAVVNNGSSNLTILLGNGDGTFTAAASPATGLYPQAAVVADLNGDGKADLAVSDSGAATTILLGNGDGTFTPAAVSPITAGNNGPLATGDFNGDGTPDFAVANGPNNSVSVFLTQRTQTATAAITNVPVYGIAPHNVDASYVGDANFSASTSPATTVVTTLPPAIIQSTIAFGSSVPYGPFAVTVTVSGTGQNPPIPSGSVFYFLDNLTTPIAIPGTLVNGSITFTLPQIALGNHAIDFSYSGDVNYAGTPNNIPPASLAVIFSVIQASGTLAVAVTPNPVRTPNPAAIVATLTSAATGATGTVTFMDGAIALGQTSLTTTGTAALNGATLVVGTHSIVAVYSGDSNFLASTAPATSVIVLPLVVQLASINPTLVTAGATDTPIMVTGVNFSASSVINFNGTALATAFVSATQLQATIPAALLINVANVTVSVTDVPSASVSIPVAFSILPPVQVTFGGPPTSDPGNQPGLTFQLQQAFPTQLDGVMTLTFTPIAGSPDNPEVQFATGGRTFNFTLAPNTTVTPAILLQAGTVAGTITVSLQLSSAGVNVTPTYIVPIAITVPTVAPTVTTVTFTAADDTLTVLVSGFSSSREIQSATFSFTSASGVSLASSSLTVPTAPLFQTWFADADSAQYGSSFTYTQPFTLSGPASGVTGVSVTLTNADGTSTQVNSQ
jgi:Bacterial Ig-like domain (group 3)/FG-GAP-like repeat